MEMDTQIAILQSDFLRQTVVISKMENMMEKLGEVSNAVAKMLAVHEEKLYQHQETNTELFALIENHKSTSHTETKDLYSSITTTHRELSSNISEVEKTLKQIMKVGLDEIKEAIIHEMETHQKDHEKRIRDLERWRWIVLGGSIVAGAFMRDVIGFVVK
jgi:methyl-accepting chemotaxis protein